MQGRAVFRYPARRLHVANASRHSHICADNAMVRRACDRGQELLRLPSCTGDGAEMTPLALDLFCGAGGASLGLRQAGFRVVGVDISPQPRYPFEFKCRDALDASLTLDRYDFIWASPPCQAHTAMKTMHNAKPHDDLIAPIRAMLKRSGKLYCIENVEGAPLINPFTLCGTMFSLRGHGAQLRRHRIFETNFPVIAPECSHDRGPTIGIYGGHVRNRKRRPGSNARGVEDFPIEAAHEAMQITYMTLGELSQAIPPAYSNHIARAALNHMRLVA